MENIHILLLVCTFVVLAFIHEGNAIKCHVCNTKYNGKQCDDPFPSSDYMKDCDLNVTNTESFPYSLCFKTVQEIEGEHRILRQCGHDFGKRKPGTCFDRTGTHKIKIKYCLCEGDGCNTASSMSSPIVLLATMSVAAMTLMKVMRL